MSRSNLHRGDCLEYLRTLPTGSVGAVITDPPYGDRTHAAGAVCRGGDGDTRETLDFAALRDHEDLIRELGRVSTGWIVAFSEVEEIHKYVEACPGAGVRYVRTGIWRKPDGAPQFTGDRPGTGFEALAIMWAGGKKMSWNGGGKHGVWTYPKGTANSKQHPTQKPLALMKQLVYDFSNPGETVLDPFMGSGTTGIAALELGREFVGVELSPEYFATAESRIVEATRQQRLF